MTRARIIVIGCVVAAALVAPAMGRDGLEGYAGVKLCAACHKKSDEQIVQKQPLSAHGAALWAVDDKGPAHKVLGDFGADAGFAQADVAYVVGKGVRAQAYLGAELNALPKEWWVASKQWEPVPAGEPKKSCLGCHTTGYDPATGKWSDPGVTCEACHGAGSSHAKSKDKLASIGRPQELPAERQAMICGRCHARGSNPDGLPFALGFKPGDDLAQSFKLDATWEPGSRYSQYNDFANSKHLAQGVVCSTCHDPHGVRSGQPYQLHKPADELCLDCHKAPLAGDQHSPPQNCAGCHMPKGSHQFEKPQAASASGAG
ncbi:MAG: hypothetical protein JSV65_15230 [Armatimonadota bacterium]|nr:MAG: hypothetical protein JSV65_15230 [Armatimonadota bacterium]